MVSHGLEPRELEAKDRNSFSMKPRAIVFDVYGTLLELLPPPTSAESESGWIGFHEARFGARPSRSWAAHLEAVRNEVVRYRTKLQGIGIPHPEVVWDEILEVAFPEWRRIPKQERREASATLASLSHRVRLFSSAGPFLDRLSKEGILLGIASNAQPYTEIELSREWARVGLPPVRWDSELCFWSWQHGFAKPDPHVFRLLDVRFRQKGLQGRDILMVGDRRDNDIEPALAIGWRGWQLTRTPGDVGGGDWEALIRGWDGL